jgi:hypothetical protein
MRILPRRDAAPPIPPNDPEAAWALVEETRDGAPMWTRVNRSLAARAGDAAYDHVVVVEVALGTGDAEELAKLGAFEDALFGVLGRDELCWPAAVRTTASERRFMLYTRDPDALAAPLAFLMENFPLEFSPAAAPDPDWQYYRALPAG